MGEGISIGNHEFVWKVGWERIARLKNFSAHCTEQGAEILQAGLGLKFRDEMDAALEQLLRFDVDPAGLGLDLAFLAQLIQRIA
jgi:hypothetical protein